jgi:hypothetical protein
MRTPSVPTANVECGLSGVVALSDVSPKKLMPNLKKLFGTVMSSIVKACFEVGAAGVGAGAGATFGGGGGDGVGDGGSSGMIS